MLIVVVNMHDCFFFVENKLKILKSMCVFEASVSHYVETRK